MPLSFARFVSIALKIPPPDNKPTLPPSAFLIDGASSADSSIISFWTVSSIASAPASVPSVSNSTLYSSYSAASLVPLPYENSDELLLKDVDGNYIWLDMSVAEYPDSIYGFIRYGGNNVHDIINTIEKVSGQTIYSEHHRYYPYIFEGTFDDGFNSVNEMINLIEHDLVSDNPQFKEEY